MRKRIFRSIFCAAFLCALLALGFTLGILYRYFENVETDRLMEQARSAARVIDMTGEGTLSALGAGDTRYTYIASGGEVLFDTHADISLMENHLSRAEVSRALLAGAGKSARFSDTLLEKTFYCAVRLENGNVLRASATQSSVVRLTLGMLAPIAAVLLVSLAISAALSGRLSKRVVARLSAIDLSAPLENDVYDEIVPLLERIARQQRMIDAQLTELEKAREEFASITGGMNEGLVLLSAEGAILSANPAALRVFGADEKCVGESYLALDHSAATRAVISAALSGERAERDMTISGRVWRVSASPARGGAYVTGYRRADRVEAPSAHGGAADDEVVAAAHRVEASPARGGAYVIMFDVTEKSRAEELRREFTANVSHELKTPLHAILGSSELLCEGMVKPEDQTEFARRIHAEASRLVTLIDDIIRLSRLDEGADESRGDIDLMDIALEAVSALKQEAEEKRVSIELTGESAVITGARALIYEIAYNLVDNAVKYNIEGGFVAVSVTKTDDGTCLSVKDTGVGIPLEHQPRVFERFYRVDKSHSRASGGTGLGLSIVKHAARYHGARIDLTSAPGKGTTVSVTFPSI